MTDKPRDCVYGNDLLRQTDRQTVYVTVTCSWKTDKHTDSVYDNDLLRQFGHFVSTAHRCSQLAIDVGRSQITVAITHNSPRSCATEYRLILRTVNLKRSKR